MRRPTTSVLFAVLVFVSPLATRAILGAQTSVYVPGGTATLTDDDPGWSILDLQLKYFFGPPFRIPVQFDFFRLAIAELVSPTVHDGATAVGFPFPPDYAGPYTFGEFEYGMDSQTLIGFVAPDATNYPVIWNGCDPLPPSGYAPDGTPFYGAVFAEIPGYFSTCAPDSYVDISFRIPHGSFIGLEPVVASPEPSALVLIATGLVGLGWYVRRRQRPAARASQDAA